jgi:UDP-N-acetyl-D-mannosaminuronic acid transferase (WecB/TagA/CpsF family)
MYYFTKKSRLKKAQELRSLFPNVKFRMIKDGYSTITVEVKNATEDEVKAIYENVNQIIASPILMSRHESKVIVIN